jgi:thermolysin metallopeptidase-like protein
METTRCACCFIVPPHILTKLATSDDPHVASTAARTLQLGKTIRLVRAQLSTGAPSPTAPTRSGLRRQIFSCGGTQDLPGDMARAENGPPSSDDAVNQAFDNAGTSWRFYKDIFGRESVDGNGLSLTSSVHYGQGYDNALWNGQQMIYGDGDGKSFRSFTNAIDVIAHELTHGVTQFTAQLPYQDQSGALNESISDVFGSMVKQWTRGQTVDQADWLIGADIFTSTFKGRGLRDMANPGTAYDDPVIGKDPQPAHMRDYVNLDPNDDFGGVHVNSGIPNKAFCLAAKAIGGRSWEVTGKIWYVMLTERLTSNADFEKCARETISVARDLYTTDASIAGHVAQAWVDVGVLPATDAMVASALVGITARVGVALPQPALGGAPPVAVAAPAAVFAVRHGHRYAATLVLSGLEQFASNGDVSDRLKQYGFVDVVVTGSGATRRAEATWNGDDSAAQADSNVRDIVELPTPAPVGAAVVTAELVDAMTIAKPSRPKRPPK